MNKRLRYIDVAKGIATLCVILGHMSLTPKLIVNEVYSFHIPLFFFLSGMVMNFSKYNNFRTFFRDKTKKVLIPYLMLSLLIWLWVAIIKSNNPFDNIYTTNSFLGIFLCAKETPYYLTLWFVLSLYLCQIIMYFIIKNRTKGFIIMVLLVAFVLGVYISIIYKPGWIFASDTLPMGLLFLGSGFMAKDYFQESSRLLNKKYFFVATLLNIGTCYANYNIAGRVDLFYQNIGNPLLYFISAFTGIWMVLIVSKMIQKNAILNFIGQNSIVFYALHRPFFFSVGNGIVNYLMSTNIIFINNNFILTLIFVIVVCVCLFISVIIINNFFPFLLGKGYKKGEKYD